ncbi:methyltransferase domain-containing protein [Breoghania sp. L-A4]|uniref:class I SAM-dependent methyltransferase n=1 Tax=Breoghania sp. L-A4 TaxID=2304600 RepID=UPI000E35D241|nr:methyltransferase domain-containing protein [Breoghania sp. L-A4]AXS41488.1 methyltransferase domain-containing protein [Breoghania sp. L-A4]
MNRSEPIPDRVRKLTRRVRSFAESLTRDAARLDENAVRLAYARWAPFYDMVFRAPLYWGRRAAVKRINELEGRVLEAGVGTGMSLPNYKPHLTVTGIDLSEEMLERARWRAEKLPGVDQLIAMDAGALGFPDNHFDVTVAMYVITVVPDPLKVLHELERVTRPGGTVILVNHFSATHGIRARVETALERFSSRLGWNPEFPKSRILGRSRLELEEEETLPPFGLFTLLSFRKPEA